MNTPARRVWLLISDVTRIGEFSPETFEAEWLGGVTDAREGARFRGHVRRNEKGPIYWTECLVTACDPEREFAFAVQSRPFGLPLAPRDTVELSWTYVLHEGTGGTEITETFQLAETFPMRLYWAVLGRLRGPRLERDMRRTLQAIKAVVESEAAAAHEDAARDAEY